MIQFQRILISKRKSLILQLNSDFNCHSSGAEGGTRTPTPRRAKDFKSFVSTIPPPRLSSQLDWPVLDLLRNK